MSEEGERLFHLFPSCPCLLMIHFYSFIFLLSAEKNAGRVVQWNGVLSQLAQNYYTDFSHAYFLLKPCDECWLLQDVQGM